jgi:hypothetical protein
VQNVSHGAEPDHEQAKLGLGLQGLIFSQGRVGWRWMQAGHEPVDGLVFALDLDAQPGGQQRRGFRAGGGKFA